jgi:ABC-type glycerol-3-phosphate transport system permease component
MALAIFIIIFAWNEFFWPLVALQRFASGKSA